MSRLLRPTLVAICTLLLGSSFVSAQVGGPPRNAPPNNPQRQPPRQPNAGPSAEEVLRLLFPPNSGQNNNGPAQNGANSQNYRPAEQRTIIRAPQRVVPSSASVAKMSGTQQRSLVRQAVVSLEQDLAKIPTGAGWKSFLRIESFGSSLWCQSAATPDSSTQDILKAIAKQFDAVKRNPDYSSISKLWGFKVAQVALPLYSESELDKQKKLLDGNLTSFVASLNRVKTGAGWKRHFQTDEVKRLASQTEKLDESQEDILKEIHKRYQEVEGNEQFKVISTYKGFADTKNSLRDIVAAMAKREQANRQQSVLKSITLRKGATGLERTVAATLKELAALKSDCADESSAKAHAALADKVLQLAGSDENEKKRLARDASEAGEILQLAKDRHDKAMDETEENLRKILLILSASRKQKQDGKTVMILPLEDIDEVEVLAPDDPDPEEAKLLPLDDSSKSSKKKKDKEADEVKVLAPEN
jgi:hypothetical protein